MNIMEEFDHQLAGIAWSLWSELGVAGTNRFHQNCLVQLEELVILTAILSKYDPRLRDEALDWASRYHEFISVSRLRALLKELDSETEHSYAQFAAAVNSVSSAKWPNAEASPKFKAKVSGKSSLPPLEAPSLLSLRLRNLFGPGAKADALAYFITRNGMHFSAADLVEIGYSKRSLMTALDHLVTSDLLSVTPVKNRKSYELKKPRELQVIIGKLPKVAPPWNKILQMIIAIRSVIPEIQASSKITQGILLRNCLTNVEVLLPAIISPLLSDPPNFEKDWKAVLEIFNAFQQGNFFMQFEVVDEFDNIVGHLFQYLYQLVDCVDGLEKIQEEVGANNQHRQVYKECYQLFLGFIRDLEMSLKQFLDFPFHRMLDEDLADIPYRFSKEELSQLLDNIRQIKPIDQITNVLLAIQQNQLFKPQLQLVRQFIYTFQKRLKDLYFAKTKISLLTQPTKLYKRHLVRELFSSDKKK